MLNNGYGVTGDVKAASNYALASQQGAMNAVAPPATIAGALGRMDGLNERLGQLASRLVSISEAIGGPRPVGKEGVNSAPVGLVFRLNDSVDVAHKQLADMEDLVGAISRALG